MEKKMDNNNSSPNHIEWQTCTASGLDFEIKIIHSTPLSTRPAPTASPNLSIIETTIEKEISQLAVLFAKLKLN